VGNITTKFTGIFDGKDNCVSNVVINSQPTDNQIGLFGYISYGSLIKNLGVENVNITGGYNAAGGMVGTSDGGKLTSCYATGSVSGDYCAGGLLGFNLNYSPVTNCYATGAIAGITYLGGLIGYDGGGALTACFWDTEASGKTDGAGYVDPDPGGVTGKTTAEMKTLSTFAGASWDFSATDGDPADWMMPANGYPRLAWQPMIEVPFKIIESGWEPTSGFTIRWTCQAGYSYQVKYSETLAVGDWHEIGSVYTANSGESSLSYTDTSGAGKPRRFYVVGRNPR
jgi:hypothetical protein